MWIDLIYRLDIFWKNVQHFVDKFQSVRSLEGINKENLHEEEVVNYQTPSLNDFLFKKTEVFDSVGDGKEVFQYQTDTLR